jgi:hypothetical protein
MCIAAHDRFSSNGIGCTASHTRIAAIVGCHLKSLSRSIRTLAECGYVGGRPNPLNPRWRCYFIVYGDLDEAIMKAPKGNEAVTYPDPEPDEAGNEFATHNEPIGNEVVPADAGIGNQLSENAQQHQGDARYNILGEALIDPAEAFLIDPVETAPAARKRALEEKVGGNVGAYLAKLQRYINAGVGREALVDAFPMLENLVSGGLDYQDANFGWAFRLFEMSSALVEERADA